MAVGVAFGVAMGVAVGIVIMPFYIDSDLINLTGLSPPSRSAWVVYRGVGTPRKYHDTRV